MIAYLKTRYAILANRLRRKRGPALRDLCAKFIMNMCGLQLERGETRQLPPLSGAVGPITVSGGAITTISYAVFDTKADRLDKTIKQETWRAFAQVTVHITLESDPTYSVTIEGAFIEPRQVHKLPALALMTHLFDYFPLMPKPYVGGVYKPMESA